MSPTGSFKRVSQPRGTKVSSLSEPTSPNPNDIIMVGSDSDKHYRQMLANMSTLVEVENLTDMTIQCAEGYYIYTHKKILSSVSPVVRKLSREHGGLKETQRLHLILNDVSRQTVSQFLKLLYTGCTDQLDVKNLDMVHALCQLLEVVLNDNSVTFYSPSTTARKSKVAKGVVRNTLEVDHRFSMGLGKPIPSAVFGSSNYKQLPSVESRKVVAREESIPENVSESLVETEISKVSYDEGERNYGATGKEGSTNRPVYCICREEERPGMIGCDYCDEWYHTQCLSLSKEEVKKLANEDWSCPNCEFNKIKSKKHSAAIRSPLISPPLSVQGTEVEVKNGTKETNVEQLATTTMNSDLIGTSKAASPMLKRNQSQDNVVANPQRNKRKRRAELESDQNIEANDGKENPSEHGDNTSPDVKRIQKSFVVKSPTQHQIKVSDNTSTSSPSEITYIMGKGSNVASTLQQEDVQKDSDTGEPKNNKENSSGLNVKRLVTKNRMTVPLQKKPRKSFEDALVEVASPAICTKKQSCVAGPSNIKAAPKRPSDKGDESSEGCLSSGEKKRVESTLLQGGSVELSTATSDLTTRATSVQSRAADDENSSPTGGNKNGKIKRLKRRSEFPKDRDIYTTSTQESSEDRGPFSPQSPMSPPLPVNLERNLSPDQRLKKASKTRPRKRTIPPVFPSNQRQKSPEKSPRDDDPASELFFCYKCKSIFVSKSALDSHRKDKGHYE